MRDTRRTKLQALGIGLVDRTTRRLEAPLTADQRTWGGRHATDFELEVQMCAD
jgi:hypothetical protein